MVQPLISVSAPTGRAEGRSPIPGVAPDFFWRYVAYLTLREMRPSHRSPPRA
jgi:hypothetical protein